MKNKVAEIATHQDDDEKSKRDTNRNWSSNKPTLTAKEERKKTRF